MHEKIKALETNGTWELIELPLGKSIIRCKWIFNVKYKVDGNIDRYKARLVAKGFMQTYGVDYQGKFAQLRNSTLFEFYSQLQSTMISLFIR